MDFFLVILALNAAMVYLAQPASKVYSVATDFFSGIAAPSSSVPSPLNSTVPASTVLVTEGSCPVSDFTSTLWFCPSSTATATATATTITSSTSTPVFWHSDIPEPATMETLAPSVTDILGITAFAALLVAVLILFACHLKQVKGAVRTFVLPGDAALSCSESIVTCTDSDLFTDRETLSTYYDWFATRETLSDIVIRQWHDNQNLQSQIAAGESAHQDEIADIKDKRNDRELTHLRKISDLRSELRDKDEDYKKQIATKEREQQNEIAAKERTHQKALAAKDRDHQIEIDRINATHRKSIDRFTSLDKKHHKNLTEEANKRKEAERRLEEVAQSSPQTLTAPAAAESSIRETEEALPVEPATTPEAKSAEPAEETSPQDVAPGTEDQLPSPPAATESPITEAKEGSPVAIPSPITDAEDELPAETEGLSEAESTNGTEHEQEEEEKMEAEPHNSGTPLLEPCSTGEGAEQIPQDQEKGLAQDAPVPTDEPAATSQLTEPEEAPGAATSDDGASEAPVPTEVQLEEQTRDRETEEPTAVAESDEAPGTSASDDGALLVPVAKEKKSVRFADGNVPEMPTAGIDRPVHSSQSGLVENWMTSLRPRDATANDLDDDPEDEPSDETLYSTTGLEISDDEDTANGHGAEQSNSASETEMDLDGQDQDANEDDLTAALARLDFVRQIDEDARMVDASNDNAVNDSSTGQTDPVSNGTSSSDVVNMSDSHATANDPGIEQSNSTGEIDGDSPMDDDSNENAAEDSENGSSKRTGEEWLGSDMVEDDQNGAANGIGSQSNDATPETAQLAHRPYGNGQMLSYQGNNRLTAETAQLAHQPHGNGQMPSSQNNNVPATEMAPSTWQQYQNAPPPQLARPLPGSIRLSASSDRVKWNLSGPATFQHHLKWRGTIEWNLSRPPTFPTPFKISQPVQQPLSSRQGLPKLRVFDQPFGSRVAIQTLQNTQSFKWQPPPPPVIQTNPPLASLAKDRLLVKATAITTWVEAANSLCEHLDRDPAEGGVDGTSFRAMKNDPNSEISKIIADTALTATFLESELKKFDLTDDAETVLRHLTLPAMLSMREKYEQLVESKGCPELFVFWKQDIDRMLKELRDLVPESSTPQAQPQQPRVNPLHAPGFKTKPLDVAKKIREWVDDAKNKCHSWEFDLEEGGTDADFFKKMNDDLLSPLWAIVIKMGDAADYLEHERETGSKSLSDAGSYYSLRVVPLVESMRGQYEELGALKECPKVFKFLLIHLDRVLEVLSKLKEESSNPPAQRQPPTQSTQQAPSQQPVSQIGNPLLIGTQPQLPQVPSQQPVPQNSNPLFSHAQPHEAATAIKNAITRMKNRPDGPMVIQEMKWTAEFLENRPKSTSKSNTILRGCVKDAEYMYQHYKQLCGANVHDQVLQSLLGDVDRVAEALKEIK